MELMYTSLTVNIRSTIIYLLGFQLLMLLLWLNEITSFVSTDRMSCVEGEVQAG